MPLRAGPGDVITATGTVTAYLSGGTGGLRVTYDRGLSWAPAGPGLTTGVFGQPHFVRSATGFTTSHGWVRRSGGTVWLTTNGGGTWSAGPRLDTAP
ncbi:MAG: beta propeller repeat protein [Mycobacteriales bacterium]